MWSAGLTDPARFEAWRDAARIAISHGIPPADLDWLGGGGLLPADPLPRDLGPRQVRVSRAFLDLAQTVIWHSAPERYDLLYQALWDLDRGGDALSQAHPVGRRLHLLAKSVRRDIHKMHAFVRFREIPAEGARRRFAAWFEPDHHTVEPGSKFFAKRFGDMDWIIATPRQTARFTDGQLEFGPGGPRPDLPDDAQAGLWNTYFANIFNPARVKLQAMQSEMPRKYWKNMPETALIPAMLRDAEARVDRMHQAAATSPRPGSAAISTRYREAMPQPVEMPLSLAEAAASAQLCQRCGLCEAATQTVWGTGDPGARLMLVGEQPGDREDLTGRPFVGPAGGLLHQVMAEAGVAAEKAWLTNAVKHFKFTPRGKQRLHQTPNAGEVTQCRWWLGLELEFIRPDLVVALGATAAWSLTGSEAPLSDRRGAIETGLHGGPVLLTWHPAHILRLTDPGAQARARAELLTDLRQAAALIG